MVLQKLKFLKKLKFFLPEKSISNLGKEEFLNWWKVNKPKFPNIAVLAQTLLSFPVSSIYSEKLFSFSKAGNIFEEKRLKILPNTDEQFFFYFTTIQQYVQKCLRKVN